LRQPSGLFQPVPFLILLPATVELEVDVVDVVVVVVEIGFC
jgi:hypothetical protein